MNKITEHTIAIIFILSLVFIHVLIISGTYVAMTDFINAGYDLQVRTSWWAVFALGLLIWIDVKIFFRKK